MNKPITEKQFFKDIKHEIDMLKEHATKKELSKLSIEYLKPSKADRCIYGLLTGSCASNRAYDLMELCCSRTFELGSSGSLKYQQFEDILDARVNGSFTSIGWGYDYNHESQNPITGKISFVLGKVRSYSTLSLLEGYIMLDMSNKEGILNYLKGDTDKLELINKNS